jgi:hypothetical protein
LSGYPAPPALNMAFYHSNNKKSYIWDGSAWQILAQDGLQGPAGTSPQINSTSFNSTGTFAINTSTPSTITSSNAAWLTTGNQGTNPNTNFIGTADGQAFVVKTNGGERIRFTSSPQVVINGIGPAFNNTLSVFGSGYPGVLNAPGITTNNPIGGYSSGSNAGLYGENNQVGQGVMGRNTGSGVGVSGVSVGNGTGVTGSNNATGIGVDGVSVDGPGMFGSSDNINSASVIAMNTHWSGNGTALLAIGSNLGSFFIPAQGAGIVSTGRYYGIYSVGTNNNGVGGIGVMGVGANSTGNTFNSSRAGVVGNGTTAGVSGFATNTTGDRWGGLFSVPGVAGAFAMVGGVGSGLSCGLISSGTKSTVVDDEQGRGRLMFCTEAPEVLFQDFGAGQLQNGSAHITLDELLSRNIRVDETHSLKVFIQLEGDCKGVFVTNKTANGFDVKELQDGRSNVSFTWQIVAVRADTKDAGGKTISAFSTQRFPVAPKFPEPEKMKVIERKMEKKKTVATGNNQ